MSQSKAPWEPVPEFSPPPAGALEALGSLWHEADRLLAGAECRACGRCCDFRQFGHVLFSAKLELDVCLAWAAEHLRTDPERARANLAEGLCPFWQEGLCAVRAVRPLGCRLFFCAKEFGRQADVAAGLLRRRLVEASEGCATLWWYGPALLYFQRNISALCGGA